MKRIYSYICVMLLAVMTITIGCNSKEKKADEQLSNAVNAIIVPHEIKKGYTVTDVTYVDKVLTYEIEIPKKEFKTLKTGETKANTLSRLQDGLFPKKLIGPIKDAGASVHYILKTKNGADYIDFTFDPEDFKTAE